MQTCYYAEKGCSTYLSHHTADPWYLSRIQFLGIELYQEDVMNYGDYVLHGQETEEEVNDFQPQNLGFHCIHSGCLDHIQPVPCIDIISH